jgi:DNA end-binding protein Ku
LRPSLVTCPIALYPGEHQSRHDPLPDQSRTNNRIEMQTLNAGTGKPVSRSDLVKG